ncbi:MAG: carbohydrate kinase family protein [Gammaproteobacteria bacterium]|nr:carbohydrate kinase family protein [Gammaproteobacteria bacterium]
MKASVREWSLLGAPACGAAELALTRGIEGGDVCAGETRAPWRAQPAVTHCDPTGAGDVFFAAFLVHRHHTADVASAAALAARVTSEFLQDRG